MHFPSEGEHERLLQGRELVLGIWDTAGSERYESMSRIYYRGAAAAVVCYDVTDADSWERLGFWVRELRKFEENCRVYVCATKKDLLGGNNKRRAVDYHNTTDYAEEEGTRCCFPSFFLSFFLNFITLVWKSEMLFSFSLFETSSKTGENVEELFLQIARDYLTDPKNRQSTADPAEDGGGDQKRNNIAIAKAPKTRKKSRSSTCCN